ncbi:MAG TPA: glycine cleavage system protein GcvH [Candidatus Bipolaricaulis anaerobius]|nr:glycine cleavage system protein GcvH [Candidatus Bipolaricaulis anaerobius]HNS24088.1 glycine cleavage system protein GcvH [Candidatus Bipolaricaulis anaerobius]
MIPQELRYTKDHEWVRLEGDKARVGITEHAQKQLGDIVFVELPPVGVVGRRGDRLATVESVKAVGEVFAPLSGEVVEVNTALPGSPDLVNKDPYGEGWLFAIRVAAPTEAGELLDAASYEALVKGSG